MLCRHAMVVNVFPPLGLANAFYLPPSFATDLVPTGTRSFAKKTSVNKKHFPAPGGNIYYQYLLFLHPPLSSVLHFCALADFRVSIA